MTIYIYANRKLSYDDLFSFTKSCVPSYYSTHLYQFILCLCHISSFSELLSSVPFSLSVLRSDPKVNSRHLHMRLTAFGSKEKLGLGSKGPMKLLVD